MLEPRFVGGAGACTFAVCTERATADPTEFVAVTTWRTVVPESAVTSVYVAAVAPEIAEHELELVQRSQARVYAIGVDPVHVPAVPVKV
jgi:hypothetical protein